MIATDKSYCDYCAQNMKCLLTPAKQAECHRIQEDAERTHGANLYEVCENCGTAFPYDPPPERCTNCGCEEFETMTKAQWREFAEND